MSSLTVKDIQPSHPATLAEVHDQVANDYRREKAVELAKTRADELAKRAKAGENFATAAKALGFDVKTTDPVARTGSIPDAGSAKQFSAAFTMPVGQAGDPVSVGPNWVVYRVAQHDPVNQDDFEKQKSKIRGASFAAEAPSWPTICSVTRSKHASSKRANCALIRKI